MKINIYTLFIDYKRFKQHKYIYIYIYFAFRVKKRQSKRLHDFKQKRQRRGIIGTDIIMAALAKLRLSRLAVILPAASSGPRLYLFQQ